MKKQNRTVNRINLPSYLFFFSKTFDACDKAENNFRVRDYDEVVSNLFDCLEFFWKAISLLVSGNYPETRHMPSESHFKKVTKPFLLQYLPSSDTGSIEKIFQEMNQDWNSNPAKRNNARYGLKENDYQNTKTFLENTLALIPPSLIEIHREIKNQNQFLIGILNGFFSNDQENEIQCDYYPWADFSGGKIEGWLGALKFFKVCLIPVCDLSPKYPIVINPFGEAYPETTPFNNNFPAFNKIKKYISTGGIFLTASGNPFHYYFDVNSGTHFETEKSLPNIPTGFEIVSDKDGILKNINVMQSTLIPTTLLEREFNVSTTMKLSEEQKEATSKVLSQGNTGKRIFEFRDFTSPIKLFRCIKPISSGTVIPILNATLDGEDCYPAALVRYGYGNLLHFGIALNSDSEKEFSLIVDILINGIIKNYLSVFQ